MRIRADTTGDHDTEPPDAAASADGDKTRNIRRRFLIIHNPLAGRNRVGLVRAVVRRLELSGAIVDFLGLSAIESDPDIGEGINAYDAVIASGPRIFGSRAGAWLASRT